MMVVKPRSIDLGRRTCSTLRLPTPPQRGTTGNGGTGGSTGKGTGGLTGTGTGWFTGKFNGWFTGALVAVKVEEVMVPE